MCSNSAGGMPSPSSNTSRQTDSRSRQLRIRIVVSLGEYFAALSSKLNKTCSKRTASTSSMGRSAARSSSTRWCAKILLARRKASAGALADRGGRGVGHVRAGFGPGHVEQVGEEAVEPSRLIDARRQQIGFLAVAERAGEVPRGTRRAEHRRERRLEIVR